MSGHVRVASGPRPDRIRATSGLCPGRVRVAPGPRPGRIRTMSGSRPAARAVKVYELRLGTRPGRVQVVSGSRPSRIQIRFRVGADPGWIQVESGLGPGPGREVASVSCIRVGSGSSLGWVRVGSRPSPSHIPTAFGSHPGQFLGRVRVGSGFRVLVVPRSFVCLSTLCEPSVRGAHQ